MEDLAKSMHSDSHDLKLKSLDIDDLLWEINHKAYDSEPKIKAKVKEDLSESFKAMRQMVIHESKLMKNYIDSQIITEKIAIRFMKYMADKHKTHSSANDISLTEVLDFLNSQGGLRDVKMHEKKVFTESEMLNYYLLDKHFEMMKNPAASALYKSGNSNSLEKSLKNAIGLSNFISSFGKILESRTIKGKSDKDIKRAMDTVEDEDDDKGDVDFELYQMPVSKAEQDKQAEMFQEAEVTNQLEEGENTVDTNKNTNGISVKFLDSGTSQIHTEDEASENIEHIDNKQKLIHKHEAVVQKDAEKFTSKKLSFKVFKKKTTKAKQRKMELQKQSPVKFIEIGKNGKETVTVDPHRINKTIKAPMQIIKRNNNENESEQSKSHSNEHGHEQDVSNHTVHIEPTDEFNASNQHSESSNSIHESQHSHLAKHHHEHIHETSHGSNEHHSMHHNISEHQEHHKLSQKSHSMSNDYPQDESHHSNGTPETIHANITRNIIPHTDKNAVHTNSSPSHHTEEVSQNKHPLEDEHMSMNSESETNMLSHLSDADEDDISPDHYKLAGKSYTKNDVQMINNEVDNYKIETSHSLHHHTHHHHIEEASNSSDESHLEREEQHLKKMEKYGYPKVEKIDVQLPQTMNTYGIQHMSLTNSIKKFDDAPDAHIAFKHLNQMMDQPFQQMKSDIMNSAEYQAHKHEKLHTMAYDEEQSVRDAESEEASNFNGSESNVLNRSEFNEHHHTKENETNELMSANDSEEEDSMELQSEDVTGMYKKTNRKLVNKTSKQERRLRDTSNQLTFNPYTSLAYLNKRQSYSYNPKSIYKSKTFLPKSEIKYNSPVERNLILNTNNKRRMHVASKWGDLKEQTEQMYNNMLQMRF